MRVGELSKFLEKLAQGSSTRVRVASKCVNLFSSTVFLKVVKAVSARVEAGEIGRYVV